MMGPSFGPPLAMMSPSLGPHRPMMGPSFGVPFLDWFAYACLLMYIVKWTNFRVGVHIGTYRNGPGAPAAVLCWFASAFIWIRIPTWTWSSIPGMICFWLSIIEHTEMDAFPCGCKFRYVQKWIWRSWGSIGLICFKCVINQDTDMDLELHSWNDLFMIVNIGTYRNGPGALEVVLSWVASDVIWIRRPIWIWSYIPGMSCC
jgi:hypothetical protein